MKKWTRCQHISSLSLSKTHIHTLCSLHPAKVNIDLGRRLSAQVKHTSYMLLYNVHRRGTLSHPMLYRLASIFNLFYLHIYAGGRDKCCQFSWIQGGLIWMVGRLPSLSGLSSYPTLPHRKHRRVSSSIPGPRLANSILKAELHRWHLGMKGSN